MNWSVFGKAFLCETVYAIPFFILSILPFKKQLRFPIKILILFIFIGQLLQSSLYTYLISHGKPTRVTDTVFAFVSLAIYFLCVKANFWKLLCSFSRKMQNVFASFAKTYFKNRKRTF